MTVKLTEYSHGAGCGCKISPATLAKILKTNVPKMLDPHLLVGNETSDDAAVYDQGDGFSIISTTDFFMPIVDDPFTFGKIAATNAISDIYAMGGTPIMAIAIFGWPIEKLPPEIAQKVIEGGRATCAEAGISLAGGHSIDSSEPIFGLAVTGRIKTNQVVKNSSALQGNLLYLTKPLGVGILATAQKKKILKKEHLQIAANIMCQLNKVGSEFAKLSYVKAMTDVTGFGLFGHLGEICSASQLSAKIDMNAVPKIAQAEEYRIQGAIPGGTQRNFDSYGETISEPTDVQKHYGCDPQTSGGLLVAVEAGYGREFESVAKEFGLHLKPFGQLIEQSEKLIYV
jgi:selenide, water dikinase